MSTTPLPPSAAATGRTFWTPSKQRIFLAALLECGSVAQAARAAGMSRSSAHRLRTKLAGTRFDASWTAALQAHARCLADPFGAEAPPPRRAPDAQTTRA